MAEILSYKDLIVWQKSMDLVALIYKLTEKFPQSEMYGLTSQVKRSAISIPANIAEGYNKASKKDYRHFLNIAYGSGAETETHIEIAKKLNFITSDNSTKAESLLNEIMRMLNKMLAVLKN